MSTITNGLGRQIPEGMLPYQGADFFIKKHKRVLIDEVIVGGGHKPVYHQIAEIFDTFEIKDGMTLSFHHHLRNGDSVLNLVLSEIKKRKLKNMILAPSAIFPVHEPMVSLIKQGNVTQIYTNYVNGPVAKAIEEGYLKDLLIMDTHGGRPRAIESGELRIDVAFIAVPTVDHCGHGNGVEGPSACGTLGYAIPDLLYAKKKIVVTDNYVDRVKTIDIDGRYVDAILHVPSIGDPNGIQSGTTKPTRDPIQLKIAKNTAAFIEACGFIKKGFSFQTGAGGTSLAVAQDIKHVMKENKIVGSFASGGITNFLVNMHEEGLFEKLYDVQCFDLEAIKSYQRNKNHLMMSASSYGNPFDKPKVNELDVVVLGATEIDLNFNVNVTTDSFGHLMGGSGGHSDTAFGAKLTIITTNLLKSRLSMVKNKVRTITTPGETVDVLVTERGIAINPRRQDLIHLLKNSSLPIVTIEDLLQKAHQITGIPKEMPPVGKVVGVVRYRDGSIIDSIYEVKGV